MFRTRTDYFTIIAFKPCQTSSLAQNSVNFWIVFFISILFVFLVLLLLVAEFAVVEEEVDLVGLGGGHLGGYVLDQIEQAVTV